MTDEKSSEPPTYEEAMMQDTVRQTEPLTPSLPTAPKENGGAYHVHNPHLKSIRGYPGGNRLTYGSKS